MLAEVRAELAGNGDAAAAPGAAAVAGLVREVSPDQLEIAGSIHALIAELVEERQGLSRRLDGVVASRARQDTENAALQQQLSAQTQQLELALSRGQGAAGGGGAGAPPPDPARRRGVRKWLQL